MSRMGDLRLLGSASQFVIICQLIDTHSAWAVDWFGNIIIDWLFHSIPVSWLRDTIIYWCFNSICIVWKCHSALLLVPLQPEVND